MEVNGRLTPGRVALVHDFLIDIRGAERVFAAICDLWPEADVFTAVYDERGTEGRFAHRRITTSFLQRLRPTSRDLPPAAPALPLRGRELRPHRLRHDRLVVERLGARGHRGRRRRSRLLLPQPVPLRLERPRGHAGRPRAGQPGGAARALQPLAPVGLDRRAARRPLRGQLAHHPAPDRPLLQPGRAGAPSAGRDDPLLARRGRRGLPGRVGAHAAQAHRRRGRGVQPAPAGRSSSSGTDRTPAACAGWPVRRSASRDASPTSASRICSSGAGRSWSRRPRSSGSPRWRPRPPAAR